MLGLVLCFAAFTTVGHSMSESPPEWSPQYSVKGVFYLPLSDLQESFAAWFDIKNNKCRVDYTDSGASVYVLPPSDSLPKGIFRKVYSASTEEESLELNCVETDLENLAKNLPIENVLPDMTDYDLIGTESLLDIEAKKWQKVVTEKKSRIEFSVWVKTEDEESIPLKYEVNVYNTLLGTHEKHFYFEYNEYNTEYESSVFDKSNDMTCRKSRLDVEDIVNPMESNLRAVRFATTEDHFKRFKLRHGREYASDLEHEERLAIFRKNLKFINEHNRGDSTYKMAVNHFADRTEDELTGLFGTTQSASDREKGLPFPYTSAEIQKLGDELPNEFDWRLRGAVTPVKDQLSCGSCWAFSAVGAVEGALFLHNNGSQHVLRLSEQALVDCSWSYSYDNHGCMGGRPAMAFEWVKKYGLPTYEAYGGYLGENGQCHIKDVKSTVLIKDFVEVKPKDENALKIAIFKHGPISVTFNAKSDTLPFYSSGVYYDPACSGESLNHAVLAVGYGVLNGQNYWLIKNSWGSWWGDNGYLLISTKDNNCGMMNHPVYVVVQ